MKDIFPMMKEKSHQLPPITSPPPFFFYSNIFSDHVVCQVSFDLFSISVLYFFLLFLISTDFSAFRLNTKKKKKNLLLAKGKDDSVIPLSRTLDKTETEVESAEMNADWRTAIEKYLSQWGANQ